MPDIKTRAVAEKAVKTIDKSAIAAQRMKTAYVQVKGKSERTALSGEESPEGYAVDQLSDSVTAAVSESVYLFNEQGQKGVAATKGNIAAAKERFQRERLSSPLKKTQEQNSQVPLVEQSPPCIKATDQSRGTVKQPVKSIEKVPSKRAEGAVKSASKSIKTSGAAGKAAVKAPQRTVWTSRQAAQTAAKTARSTAQTAHTTQRTAASTAKKAVKSTVSAVRAIITGTKVLVAAIFAAGWVAVIMLVLICMIGLIAASPFGIFFSGEDTGTGQTMPAVVREINQDYEGKLDEIKASNPHDVLAVSGSHAVWPEVLAVYAVRTAADPDAPQEVATMDNSKKDLLKEIFWAMNEVSDSTATGPVEVVTETDDGHGNIIESTSTITGTTLYITASHKTADEMADIYHFNAGQRRQLAELLAEGNRSIWSSVLYGIGAGDGEIVAMALSQIGNAGGQPYWSWYGFGSHVDWCACFVSWCANECGYIDTGVIPRFAGCINGAQWFKDRGLWQDNSYVPRPGDVIFFDWNSKGDSGPQDGLADHVGIVEKVEDDLIYTVEGNSGDNCRERRYPIGHYEICGYGTPAY